MTCFRKTCQPSGSLSISISEPIVLLPLGSRAEAPFTDFAELAAMQ